MQEVKFNYQNISVDFDSDYIFTVTNKNLFVNTSVFDAFAILLADGEEVYRTKLQMSVPPMDRASYEVPVTLKNSMIDVEKEYCIVVSLDVYKRQAFELLDMFNGALAELWMIDIVIDIKFYSTVFLFAVFLLCLLYTSVEDCKKDVLNEKNECSGTRFVVRYL